MPHAWTFIRTGSSLKALQAALDGLMKDTSFETSAPDETFRRLNTLVSSEIDFLIAGHTHLEKSIPRNFEMGVYFNSGTWARLIHLSRETLQNEEKFSKVFDSFKSQSLAALDKLEGLVEKRCSVVRVARSGQDTVGEILRVSKLRSKYELKPVPGTKFLSKA